MPGAAADPTPALRALAEPRRVAILRLVRGHERSAGDIAARFAVTRPAISQHLRVLVEVGLVSERRVGTHRYYQARPEGLRDVQLFLQEFWDSRLEQLRLTAEQDHRSRGGRPSRRQR